MRAAPAIARDSCDLAGTFERELSWETHVDHLVKESCRGAHLRVGRDPPSMIRVGTGLSPGADRVDREHPEGCNVLRSPPWS